MLGQLDIVTGLLDNPELMEKYGYTDEDLDKIRLTREDDNEFISFIKTVVKVVEENPNKSERVHVKKIFSEINLK